MNTFKSTIARTAIAFGLALGVTAGLAMPAAASPYYHVTIDTSSLAGQDGYLDFLILALASEGRVHATIGSISDTASGPGIDSGDVAAGGSPYVTIGNGQGWNEFGQWVHFDDQLTFNLAFALDPTTPSTSSAYTTLQVALVGDDQVSYLGFNQDLVDFDLRYGEAPGVRALDGIATVTQVPEAPALWLSMTGLGLIGALRRRSA
jgi:MYXO-CTERM domain-containing protein